MSRITAPGRDELPELEGLFTAYEQIMGVVPENVRTMGRVPGLAEAYAGVALASAMNGIISEELAQLAGHMASAGAGCRYCQAHTAAHAEKLGVDPDKLAEVWSFRTSDRFDAGERAALELAFASGQHPNAVTDAHFDACREHFTEDQIAAIVAVCSLFGFLNRWNDTVATTLEAGPFDTAMRVLAPQGWEPGRAAPSAGN